MSHADLLFELGCEELPPKALNRLGQALFTHLSQQLDQAGFPHDAKYSRWFATPRRLAIHLTRVRTRQADRTEQRRGPALKAAFDAEGKPTPAALGFARSCGVDVEQLERLETDKGQWLAFSRKVEGRPLSELLPAFLQQALDALPIPKRMRWGDHPYAFVRPVHWLVCLLDDQVVPMTLFGIEAGAQSRGHRFLHPQAVTIPHARDYLEAMRQACVLVCPQQRREQIVSQCEALGHELNGQVLFNAEVLDEVVNLVEWPQAIHGTFDADFLQLPRECLITSMEVHQRFFPLQDQHGRLLSRFIGIANNAVQQPEVIAAGYEKVIRPRLADARFFWDSDRSRPLMDYQPQLAQMVFQQKLGTLLDKTRRLEQLSAHLAPLFGVDVELLARAAALCKCDLVTDMVYEFPELQGIMGHHYALASGEDPRVAQAIEDHYRPRFSDDALPTGALSTALAVADRLDTLCGIFAAGLKPTGNKDPFALRRAALGLVRMLSQQPRGLSLAGLIDQAWKTLPVETDSKLQAEVQTFVLERFRGWAQDQGYSHGCIEAVLARQSDDLADACARMRVLDDLRDSHALQALAQANKRINNILKKNRDTVIPLQTHSLQAAAEIELHRQLEAIRNQLEKDLDQANYRGLLESIATLHQPVDQFFDQVMVMVEDDTLRNNRLALLRQLQQQLNLVADLSRLD